MKEILFVFLGTLFVIVLFCIFFTGSTFLINKYFTKAEITYAVTVYIGDEIIPYYIKDRNVENGKLKYVDEDGLTWVNFQYNYRKLESEVEK